MLGYTLLTTENDMATKITKDTELTKRGISFIDSEHEYIQTYVISVDGKDTNVHEILSGNQKTKMTSRNLVVKGVAYKTPKAAFEADGYVWDR